ncbi:hypothetical protein_gp008 [Bacillus phage vB_BceM_WH1]|nr:hypothetical protein_gp008 [Bacillus phage vB_BceM_WH1]
MELDRDEIIYLKLMLIAGESYMAIRQRMGTNCTTIYKIATSQMYDVVYVPEFDEAMEERTQMMTETFPLLNEKEVSELCIGRYMGDSIMSLAEKYGISSQYVQQVINKYKEIYI